jgi:hypothetical protein
MGQIWTAFSRESRGIPINDLKINKWQKLRITIENIVRLSAADHQVPGLQFKGVGDRNIKVLLLNN